MRIKIFFSAIFLFLYTLTTIAQPVDNPLHVLKKHTGAITSIAFSDDSNVLLTGSDDKTAILWDLVTQLPVKTFNEHVATVQAVGFVGNKYYLTAGHRGVYVWDINGKFVSMLSGNSTYIYSFSISNDLKKLVAGSFDMFPRIWNLEKLGKWENNLQGGHTKNALVARFSPNGKFIATGSLDKTVIVWSTDSLKVLYTLKGHAGNIFDIQWFSDSKHFISASDDRSMLLWEVGKQQALKQLKGHQAAIVSAAISPDDRFILSASADNTICMWEVVTGKRIYSYSVNSMPVNAVAISKNGKYFAAGTTHKNVYIYNYTPLWVVDYYYSDSIKNRIQQNELFAPKLKGESKEAFEIRKAQIDKALKGIYAEFFERYILTNSVIF